MPGAATMFRPSRARVRSPTAGWWNRFRPVLWWRRLCLAQRVAQCRDQIQQQAERRDAGDQIEAGPVGGEVRAAAVCSAEYGRQHGEDQCGADLARRLHQTRGEAVVSRRVRLGRPHDDPQVRVGSPGDGVPVEAQVSDDGVPQVLGSGGPDRDVVGLPTPGGTAHPGPRVRPRRRPASHHRGAAGGGRPFGTG